MGGVTKYVVLFIGLLILGNAFALNLVVNRSYNTPASHGVASLPEEDCQVGFPEVMLEAYRDGQSLARAAYDVLKDTNRASRFTTLYDKIFTLNGVRPATKDVAREPTS